MSDKPVPTGGRAVIGPDGTGEWKRFYDRPLSREESEAVKWFTELSPNEQLREVRRLKWNLDRAREDTETWKRVAREHEREALAVQAKLAVFTPEGFTVPWGAADLLNFAEERGWKTVKAWTVDRDDETSALLRIILRNGEWIFKFTWSADKGGGGRMFGRGLAQAPGRYWHDAPSLKAVKEIIEENGS